MRNEIKTPNKFKSFKAICDGGTELILKSPQGKVTLKTALLYANHWAKMQHGIQTTVIGIKGID